MNTPKRESLRIWEEKDYHPSAKTIKTIIQVGNNFIDFLKRKDPKEFGDLSHLLPISRNKLKDHEARRPDKKDPKRDGFVKDEHWKIISKTLQNSEFINDPKFLNGYDIFPFVKLGYLYGLRRGESLGVSTNDVRKGFLHVERQLASIEIVYEEETLKDVSSRKKRKERKKVSERIPTYQSVKDYENRETPHWFSTVDELYETIDKIGQGQCQLIHPDTLTEKWKITMEYLFEKEAIDMVYDIHDLRGTFITKALRDHAPIDVMRAVGHQSIETTMKYVRNERNLSSEVYKPKKMGEVISISRKEKKKTG